MHIQPPSLFIGFWKNLSAFFSTDEVLNPTVIEQEGQRHGFTVLHPTAVFPEL